MKAGGEAADDVQAAMKDLEACARRVAPALSLTRRQLVEAVLAASDAARERNRSAEQAREDGDLPKGTRVVIVRCACERPHASFGYVGLDHHRYVKNPLYAAQIPGVEVPGYLLRLVSFPFSCHAYEVTESPAPPRRAK